MTVYRDLFKEYEHLAGRADLAFRETGEEYPGCVRCVDGCSDCCHSVFGLFLIESVYINHHYNRLGRRLRREVAARGDRADRELGEVEKKLRAYDHDPRLKALAMARERVRCPLLDSRGKCVLYAFRPVTCRVYGIPSVINGKVHVCWKAGFEKGRTYPAFDLDGMYRELYALSRRLLQKAGAPDMDRASLLVSVSRSIKTPVEDLISLS